MPNKAPFFPIQDSAPRVSFLHNLLNYLVVFVVFSGALVYGNFWFIELRFFYLIIALTLLLWLPILRDFVFNKIFLLPFFFLILTSIICVLIGLNSKVLLLKQVFGIGINAIWFYIFIKINEFNIVRIFKIYLNIAFVVALIGLFQYFSYSFNFTPGYNYKWFLPFWIVYPTGSLLRINSILPEPAGFCVSMMPALFVSIHSFIAKDDFLQHRLKSLIILIVFFMSFSSVGYFGAILVLLVIGINYRQTRTIFIIAIASCLFFFAAFKSSPDFRNRLLGYVKVINKEAKLEKVNLSVYASYSNFLVTKESFFLSPLIGSGFGSYELTYRKYIDKVTKLEEPREYVNMHDSSSLFLRLLSETGLFGLGLFLFFISRFYLFNKNKERVAIWVINNSIFVFFIIRLIRVGHYFTDGFFLFFWMYYVSKIKYSQIEKT